MVRYQLMGSMLIHIGREIITIITLIQQRIAIPTSRDFAFYGFLFEALCTRDIRIYAQSIDGDVFHYRDKSGLEADLIVRLRDGRWAAIEVKMGTKQIEEAAKNLLTLKAKINDEKMGKESFLMILTGGQYAYRRNDGIWIVPIGCLKN